MTAEPPMLRQGRERYQRQAKADRELKAVQRVAAYQRWLGKGCRGPMPCLPSTAEFKIARGER